MQHALPLSPVSVPDLVLIGLLYFCVNIKTVLCHAGEVADDGRAEDP